MAVLFGLANCFTFNYGPIGYMEPGGAGADPKSAPVASHCITLMTEDAFSAVWKKASADVKTYKDATFTLNQGAISGCLELRGTPVK